MGDADMVCELVLASASSGRAQLLRDAGLAFRQLPANVDERALEKQAVAGGQAHGAENIALFLAGAKAEQVSRNNPGALVIGADQVMECGGELFSKPANIDAARGQLQRLRGRTHSLHSGLSVARDGEVTWRHCARADLTMRDFSEPFLDEYCRKAGEGMLQSVGAYRIEGLGVQLFSRIDGDSFAIIGLPLLPLLGYLRQTGWLRA